MAAADGTVFAGCGAGSADAAAAVPAPPSLNTSDGNNRRYFAFWSSTWFLIFIVSWYTWPCGSLRLYSSALLSMRSTSSVKSSNVRYCRLLIFALMVPMSMGWVMTLL